MKNLLTITALIFGMFLTFVSCQKEDSLVSDENLSDSENIFIKKVTNTDLINEFKSKVTTLKSTESIIFDTDNIFEVGLSESDPKVLIANQVGFDECNDSNFGFTIAIDDNGNLGQAAIVKTENVDEQTKIINYYDDDNSLILSLKLDANTESIETLYKQPRLKSTGQDVADCVADAYTNHGWVSVWAFVQTAFIPATAGAIAGACLVAQL
jgi:hypothetical protein